MDIFQVRDILLSYKGQDLTELYDEYGFNTPSNKGKFGLLIENILGLNNNSIQEPDFGDFELKCIPLKKLKNGKLTFKETVAITMINPDNIIGFIGMIDAVNNNNKPYYLDMESGIRDNDIFSIPYSGSCVVGFKLDS